MSLRSLTILTLACAALAACAAPSSSSDASGDVAETPVESGDALTKAHNDLTATQAKSVLGMLDDVCGDTWCEGDYDWQFKKLTCDFGQRSCTLTVFITDPGTTDSKSDDKTYWRSCKMQNAGAKIDDLVDTAKNGYQSLNETFYDKVDACITKLEDGIPH